MLALGALCSGCSFVFVTPAPAHVSQPSAHPHADCTSSRVAPVLDAIATGYELARVGYAAQASDSDYRRLPIDRGTDLALGAASAALFLSSTIYGFVNTSACSRLKQGPPLGEEMPGITREPEPDPPGITREPEPEPPGITRDPAPAQPVPPPPAAAQPVPPTRAAAPAQPVPPRAAAPAQPAPRAPSAGAERQP